MQQRKLIQPTRKARCECTFLTKDEKIYKINDVIADERKLITNRNLQYKKHYNQIAPTNLSYYKLLKLIGTGSFGKVLLAECILTGKLVAIKAFDKEYLKDPYSKNKVTREIYLQRNISHENVIRLFEVFYNETHLFIVMEYACNGDLLHYLKSKKRLSEAEARKLFRQIVYGLAHIHCRSILHRDIKLDNLLLDEDMSVKICDFGVSRIIGKCQLIKEQCGTPAYLAPEIIINKGYSGYNSDIWSLGIVLYAMLCGTVPYRGNSLQELIDDIRAKEILYPPFISKESKDLISKLIVVDPYKRMCIADILKHPWFLGNSLPFNEENAIVVKEEFDDKSDISEIKLSNLFDRQIPKKIYMHDYPYIKCDVTKQLSILNK